MKNKLLYNGMRKFWEYVSVNRPKGRHKARVYQTGASEPILMQAIIETLKYTVSAYGYG